MANSIFKLIVTMMILTLISINPAMALKGGRFTRVSEFPSSLHISTLIIRPKADGGYEKATLGCTATKISENLILTAAHCYYLLLPGFSHQGIADKLTEEIMIKQNDGTTSIASFLPIQKIYYNHGIDLAIVEVILTSNPNAERFRSIPSAKISFEPLLTDDKIEIGGYGLPNNSADENQRIKMSTARFQSTTKLLDLYRKNPIEYTNGHYQLHDVASQLSTYGNAKKHSGSKGNGRVMSGDSGGSVYRKTTTGFDIVGVNSSVANECAVFCGSEDNYFVRMDNPTVQDWIRSIVPAN